MKSMIFLLLFFSMVIYQRSYGQIPTNGLVGEWLFNGNANDESGNGFDGTVDGATLTEDRFGNSNSAYYFDGSASQIFNEGTIRSTFDNNNAYSINLWFYPVDTLDELIVFACDGNNVAPYKRTWISLNIKGNDKNIQFSRFNNSTMVTNGEVYFFSSLPDSFQLNQWYHLSVNYDGDDAVVYLNSNVLSRIDNTGWSEDHNKTMGGPDNLTTGIKFGKNYQNNKIPFKGKIDDIRIYDRTLSSNEIRSIFYENVCQEVIYETVYDTLTVNVYDTTAVVIQDTVQFYVYDTTTVVIPDTLHIEVNDTTTIVVQDTIWVEQLVAVTDTLFIDYTVTSLLENLNNLIKVYPNPTSDILIIESSDFSQMKDYDIVISDLSGAEVFRSKINQMKFEIHLKDFGDKGIYFLNIYRSDGTLNETRKIVLR